MLRRAIYRTVCCFLSLMVMGTQVFVPAIAQAQTPQTLSVQGTTLKLPNGNRFIVKGTNLELFRDSGCSFITNEQYPIRSQIIQKMKGMGINAVRLNYKTSWLQENAQNLVKFLDVMQGLADQGIYSMPSDHSFTGKDLNNRATSYPLFQKIIDGARARGIEGYLIMNPYNEPGPTEWAPWITANKDTLTFLRNTANYKGVVVLDTRSWAADYDVNSLSQVKSHDATLLGGTPNVVFSNHWYPNHALDRINTTITNAGTIPIMIGELGQINPGVIGLTPQYPKDVLNAIVTNGITKGHNGVFAWMWNWCDENTMTDDDYLTLNTYGQMYVNSYFSKVTSGTPPTSTPVATSTPAPTSTPTPTPSPTPSPTPTACQKADINQDHIVDISDYTILSQNFFKSPPTNARADINKDGIADLTDYAKLVASFLQTCP